MENWIKTNRNNIFLVIDEAHHATAKSYIKIINKLEEENRDWFKLIGLTATPFRTEKVVGAALGTNAIGLGIHLLVDVFQPKSINFPFFDSLVDKTLVKDNIYLLGNSLWAFKISHDLFVLAMAEELESVRLWVTQRLGREKNALFDRD